MKPFYCSKISNGKWKFNGPELVIKKVSKDTLNRVDRLLDEEHEYKRKHVYIHNAFYKIQMIFSFIGLYGLAFMFFCLIHNVASLNELIWQISIVASFFGGIGFLSIECWVRKRKRNYEESEISGEFAARIDAMFDSMYSEMGVPLDAYDVDFLRFNYKLKGADVVPFKVGRYGILYEFVSLKFYKDKKNLYMASDEEVYAISLSDIKCIKKFDKRINFKVDKSQKKRIMKFQKHNIKRSFGEYTIDSQYIMEFEHKGDLWCLYFPWYELPVIEELTGVKAK